VSPVPALLAHAADLGDLAGFGPTWVLLGAYGLIVALLVGFGRPGPGGGLRSFLLRIADGLERATGITGWAAATAGTALFAVLLAGVGFYNDVAWHVALGRDKELFTAPHTAIVLGLAFIPVAAAVGVLFATLQRADVGLRVGAWRVPWSSVAIGTLGITALAGFPLDDVWHAKYGIDVTMWSPTHLIMIVGAALTPLAAWLALGESGVPARRSRRTFAVHVVTAGVALQGLSAVQGEFAFGVPQFQQLYLPVLIAAAAGFLFVAARLALGPGWAFGVSAVGYLMERFLFMDTGPLTTKATALYVGSGLVVEVVAAALGTRRRARFAVVSGLGIGTVGFATEWLVNADAHQPWTVHLLPDAVLVGTLAAVGAALVGAAFAPGITRMPGLPARLVAAGGLAVVVALALPLPRPVGAVAADIEVSGRGEDADVVVRLDPPDAADEARWFQVLSWQGGDLHARPLREVSPGTWLAEGALPLRDASKTVLRLHRGGEMMAVPLRFPPDPELGLPAVEPQSRRARFQRESDYLLREQHGGDQTLAVAVYGVDLLLLATWVAALGLAVRRPRRSQDATSDTSAQSAATSPTDAMATLRPTGARSSSPSR
jgi:hypothetical protein